MSKIIKDNALFLSKDWNVAICGATINSSLIFIQISINFLRFLLNHGSDHLEDTCARDIKPDQVHGQVHGKLRHVMLPSLTCFMGDTYTKCPPRTVVQRMSKRWRQWTSVPESIRRWLSKRQWSEMPQQLQEWLCALPTCKDRLWISP